MSWQWLRNSERRSSCVISTFMQHMKRIHYVCVQSSIKLGFINTREFLSLENCNRTVGLTNTCICITCSLVKNSCWIKYTNGWRFYNKNRSKVWNILQQNPESVSVSRYVATVTVTLWTLSIAKMFVLLLIRKFPKVKAFAQKLALLRFTGRLCASLAQSNGWVPDPRVLRKVSERSMSKGFHFSRLRKKQTLGFGLAFIVFTTGTKPSMNAIFKNYIREPKAKKNLQNERCVLPHCRTRPTNCP